MCHRLSIAGVATPRSATDTQTDREGEIFIKWFKHISDSLDDPFIFNLIDRFGGDGYLVFFGTLEVMAREFDINSPGICQLSVKFLAKKLQISVKKLKIILKFCSENERIFAEFNGCLLTLTCPKLKDMCDEFTRKVLNKKETDNAKMSGASQDTNPINYPLEVRSKKKEEEEEENNTTPTKEKTFSQTSEKLAKKLFYLIQQNDPKAKKPNFSSWAGTIDKLMRIDGRSEQEISRVMEFCQNDSFWKSNILSADKLRKQFSRLAIKAKQEKEQDNDIFGRFV